MLGEADGISRRQYSPSPPPPPSPSPPAFLYPILNFTGFLFPSLEVLTHLWCFLGFLKVLWTS